MTEQSAGQTDPSVSGSPQDAPVQAKHHGSLAPSRMRRRLRLSGIAVGLATVTLVVAVALSDRRSIAFAVQSDRAYQDILGRCSDWPRGGPRPECLRGRAAEKRDSGVWLAAHHDRDNSLIAFLVARLLLEKARQLEPANQEVQFDLYTACWNVAEAFGETGRVDQAIRAYQEALAIGSQVVASSPNDVRWLCAHSRLRLKYARYMLKHHRNWDEFREAQTFAENAVEVMHCLQEQGQLPVVDVQALPRYREISRAFSAVGGMYGQ